VRNRITHALAAGEIGNVRANYTPPDCKVLNEADFALLSGHLEVDAGQNFTVRKPGRLESLDIFLIQIRFSSWVQTL
jgi:hypothetical protein